MLTLEPETQEAIKGSKDSDLSLISTKWAKYFPLAFWGAVTWVKMV